MNFTRVLIGALVIAAGVAGREYRTTAYAATHPTSSEVTTPSAADLPESSSTIIDESVPHMDVYGNEVDDAIGDYHVDGSGDLYESHSPDTEVPRLGTPKA